MDLRSPVLIAGIAILIGALLVAGCVKSAPAPTTIAATPAPEATVQPPSPTPTVSCQLYPCHGMDLACTGGEPRSCTMEYKLGDRCRQYASCQANSDGTCKLVTGSQFNTCKACVNACAIRAGDDSVSALDCESKC